MSKSFNWLALSMRLAVPAVQLIFNYGQTGRELPLLTTLFINEVGGFVSLFGLISGLKRSKAEGSKPATIISILLCAVLAGLFFWMGYQHWVAR